MGDPLLPGTDIGPLATEDIRAEIEMQVDESVKSGAKLKTHALAEYYVMTPSTLKSRDVPGVLYLPVARRQEDASDQRRPALAGRSREWLPLSFVVLQVFTKLRKTFQITRIDLEEGRLIASFGTPPNEPEIRAPGRFLSQLP